MSVLVAIPARFGASRFPGKPLKLLQGKPIIAWVVEQALQSEVGPVLVATDHEEIAEAAARAGAEVTMTPPELPSGTDRVAYAITSRNVEVILNVQGDEPLIEPGHIALAADLLQKHPQAHLSTLATPITEGETFFSRDAVKVVLREDGSALYFSRSPIPHLRDRPEHVPEGALRHLGLYGYRREVLLELVKGPQARLEMQEKLEQLRALHRGLTIQVGVVERAARGVDSVEDLAFLQAQLEQ